MVRNIQELVNQAIANDRTEREHLHWHASGIGNCMSGQYYERLGKDRDFDFDERTLRVFSVGNVFEDWLLRLLEKQLPEHVRMERQEDLVDKELDVSGHPDAVLLSYVADGPDDVEVDDEATIIDEVKTIHSGGFTRMQRDGKPYRHHEYQLWLYLYMKGVARGELIYLSKDDLRVAQYPVLLEDEQLRSEVLKILNALNHAWKTKKAPTPNLDPQDWRYQRCGWHLQCLEGIGETVFHQQFWSPKKRGYDYRDVPIKELRAKLKEAK